MVLARVKPGKHDLKKVVNEINKKNKQLKKTQGDEKSDEQIAKPSLTIARSMQTSGLCERSRKQAWDSNSGVVVVAAVALPYVCFLETFHLTCEFPCR